MTAFSIRFVGLDVHKRVVEVCIIDHEGKIVFRQRFPLNRQTLEHFAATVLRPTDRVALEATTNSFAVADVLRPHVAEVVVSNPMATRAIAQAKTKTDQVDAHVIAQLLRCGYLPAVWQPGEQTRRRRELTARRSALVGHRTAVKNRIHSLLAGRLIEAPPRLFSPAGRVWLQAVQLDEQGRMLLESDLRLLDFVEQEMERLDDELARRGQASDAARLLMSLPGVDVATAEGLVAAWGDWTRFPDGDRAASYLGLVPSTKQSAEHCYHGPITKRGRAQARWLLVEAAQHLDKHPGPLGNFFRRLAKKKHRNVAVVAAARKLAAIAWRMLTRHEPYRYAIPRSTETKLARLRVKATGQRRTSGNPKGTKCAAKLPGGSRTIKPLAEVYRAEGLPAPEPLSAGEQRTVAAAGCQQFVARLAAEQLVPRRAKAAAEDRPTPTTAAARGDAAEAAPTAAEDTRVFTPEAESESEHPARAGTRKVNPTGARPSGRGHKVAHPAKARTAESPPSGSRRAAAPTDRRPPHASCGAFRQPPAGEQGDEAPPPAPPTLFSIPEPREETTRSPIQKKSTAPS